MKRLVLLALVAAWDRALYVAREKRTIAQRARR